MVRSLRQEDGKQDINRNKTLYGIFTTLEILSEVTEKGV